MPGGPLGWSLIVKRNELFAHVTVRTGQHPIRAGHGRWSSAWVCGAFGDIRFPLGEGVAAVELGEV